MNNKQEELSLHLENELQIMRELLTLLTFEEGLLMSNQLLHYKAYASERDIVIRKLTKKRKERELILPIPKEKDAYIRIPETISSIALSLKEEQLNAIYDKIRRLKKSNNKLAKECEKGANFLPTLAPQMERKETIQIATISKDE